MKRIWLVCDSFESLLWRAKCGSVKSNFLLAVVDTFKLNVCAFVRNKFEIFLSSAREHAATQYLYDAHKF